MENLEKLKKVFSEALNIDKSKVNDNFSHGSDEWDSVSHMVLISQLEEGFNISIDIDEVIGMSNFVKVKEILEKHQIKF